MQEVIRQLAERLASWGHEVTVATTELPGRTFTILNGVKVRGFKVAGNHATGMSGEIDVYQRFVQDDAFDLVMVYAAQQWTFDAMWPVLGAMRARKVFVPCGFAGLYEPGYRRYFEEMPKVLRQFDRLVFNATHYRDIDLARSHGLDNFVVLPNGANEREFAVPVDDGFRARHQIAPDAFLVLTVGSFTGLKGHLELASAFEKLALPEGRRAALILNGNEVQRLESGAVALARKFVGVIRTQGLRRALKQVASKLSGSSSTPRSTAENINRSQPSKQVLVTDLPRAELTQAFMAADLFVLASNIEYSPLVLFEAAAAGTPFLTVDVGNALEIAAWTGGGVACPSSVDERGYTRVDEAVLAASMASLAAQPALLEAMGKTGQENWRKHFSWQVIARQYERLFLDLVERPA
ncbi:MAG: glycosyltransferase family 4 protein [Polaromonas sp.]|nr:glycosyltransferase family 4 protein [Polaromonas sp.]